jgi:hypothetical protein
VSADVYDELACTEDDYATYRALSMAAVVALLLGIISLASLLFAKLLFIPLVGLGFAVYALRTLNRHRDELSGKGLARAGFILCLLSFLGGTTIAATVYATEVPEGYKRISFLDLQPDPRRPDLPISPKALELDGQRIFVKGYIYPSDRASQLKRFVLVPDMGTCCFGGQPALTDMIEVTLKDPLRARFSYQRRKLGGVLSVDKSLKEVSGLTGVYYQLDADYLR